MSEIVKLFSFLKENDVRVVMREGDNDPWFVAKDICKILDIKNYRDKIKNFPKDEKGVVFTDTPGGKQNISIVSIPGLFRLTFTSIKPEAKKLQYWVFHEVLPSIAKYGQYSDSDHPIVRSVGKIIRNDCCGAIKTFIKYSKNRDENFTNLNVYSLLSSLANKYSKIKDGTRDLTDSLNLCLCMFYEAKICSILNLGMINKWEPKIILQYLENMLKDLNNIIENVIRENNIKFNFKELYIDEKGNVDDIYLKVNDDGSEFSIKKIKIKFRADWIPNETIK